MAAKSRSRCRKKADRGSASKSREQGAFESHKRPCHAGGIESSPAIVDYYARRAAEYERIYAKPERQAELTALHGRFAGDFSGKLVLELACGTGYWTQTIARSASAILALDCNEAVLEIARAKRLDPAIVEFRRGDAYEPEVGPRRFDAGFAGFWWSHVPRRRLRDFLVAFHRVLEPGARVVFVDNRYVEGSSTPVARMDTCGDTYQIRALDDGSQHEVLKNFPDDAELGSVVSGLGDDVRVDCSRYYWVMEYRVRGGRT